MAVPDGSDKRQLERQLFDEFCRFTPDIKLILIDQPSPPAADILAEFDGRQIGIEITRYFSDDERKRRESEENTILESAKEQYELINRPKVGVRVSWAPYDSRCKTDRTVLAGALANLIATNVPPSGGRLVIEGDALPETLDRAVQFVSLDRLVDYTDNAWFANRSGWFPNVEVDDVQKFINLKEKNFDGYKQNCEEVWLLVSSERSPSSWCELAPAAQSATYRTKFERVFFVGNVAKRSVPLRTNASRSSA